MLRPIARVLDLVPDDRQHRYEHTPEQAREILRSEQPESLLDVEGSFALTARVEERVLMARSLDRPLRYFLAKEKDGPMLVVAERIDEILRRLEELSYGSQFHPTYTRMVPAHHVTSLRLIGCPDPNPIHRRFFDPPLASLPPDLDVIGERYVAALLREVRRWLEAEARAAEERGHGAPPAPLGVCFSGGIDSGAVLLAVYHALLDLGQAPSRLKAFTLRVGDGGEDVAQAREFLRRTGLELLGEEIERPVEAVDPFRAIDVIEDYKPLDVECAAVGLALLEGIRERYPEWRLLIDGDGGDENLKDYPIEVNAELTIRSVVSNQMLYQEGWGVDAIKHSLTYSGGQSRGCVRTFAPARRLGFVGFSPFTRPAVIAVAEAIPFDRLTQGSNERLYSLKGEVVRRGFRRLLGVEMPIFEKRRFQHGATPGAELERLFAVPPERYRQHFLARYARA